MKTLRRLLRLPRLVALLFAGLAIEVLLFPRVDEGTRERILAGWSRRLLAACGLRVQEDAASGAVALPRLPGGRMLVANHRSWLDIFAIMALAPARFVSKAEVRGWPLVGRLCALAGTLFIERHRRHAVHAAIGRMVAALRDGDRVAIFPEGTTNDGRALHRFHANLLEAAVEAGADVVPVVLRYRDARGGESEAVLFTGTITIAQSLWWILGERRTTVRVTALPAISVRPEDTRHALARRVEGAIRAELGLPDEAVPQDTGPVRQAVLRA